MACETEEIHVGDVGTVLEVPIYDCGVLAEDIQQATVKKIYFKNKDNEVFEKTADFKTDGTDSVIQYVTEAGFLNVKGKWKMQAYVVLPSGGWNSSIECFTVYPNIGTRA